MSESKYSHLDNDARQRLIKDKKNQRAVKLSTMCMQSICNHIDTLFILQFWGCTELFCHNHHIEIYMFQTFIHTDNVVN